MKKKKRNNDYAFGDLIDSTDQPGNHECKEQTSKDDKLVAIAVGVEWALVAPAVLKQC